MDSLFMRREKLCRKFTQKSLKNPKFKQWFKPNLANLLTRKVQPKFHEIWSRTRRFEKSPIGYFTNILNGTNIKSTN